MGSVGDSCNDTLEERVSGLYKAELIATSGRPNLQAAELATLAWVH